MSTVPVWLQSVFFESETSTEGSPPERGLEKAHAASAYWEFPAQQETVLMDEIGGTPIRRCLSGFGVN
jgi:hypothetical protein